MPVDNKVMGIGYDTIFKCRGMYEYMQVRTKIAFVLYYKNESEYSDTPLYAMGSL